jgi:hypothetical protein
MNLNTTLNFDQCHSDHDVSARRCGGSLAPRGWRAACVATVVISAALTAAESPYMVTGTPMVPVPHPNYINGERVWWHSLNTMLLFSSSLLLLLCLPSLGDRLLISPPGWSAAPRIVTCSLAVKCLSFCFSCKVLCWISTWRGGSRGVCAPCSEVSHRSLSESTRFTNAPVQKMARSCSYVRAAAAAAAAACVAACCSPIRVAAGWPVVCNRSR